MTIVTVTTTRKHQAPFNIAVEFRDIHNILNLLEESKMVESVRVNQILTKISKHYFLLDGYTKLLVND